MYLADERNQVYHLLNASPIPFDADVNPGKSVDTALTFKAPANARKLYLEMRMKRITYASFIIGSSPGPWSCPGVALFRCDVQRQTNIG